MFTVFAFVHFFISQEKCHSNILTRDWSFSFLLSYKRVQREQVPHSHCSLWENPEFLKNLELKIAFLLTFFFNIYHFN
jgi:hypothetical protein